jgi:uncharacterized protein (DUF3820 family)
MIYVITNKAMSRGWWNATLLIDMINKYSIVYHKCNVYWIEITNKAMSIGRWNATLLIDMINKYSIVYQ